MTTQVIYKLNEKGEVQYISVKDHAGYNKKGEDIVCAAISAITNGTINFLATHYPDDCQIFCQSAAIIIRPTNINLDCQLCFRLLLYQLQNIAKQYSHYLEIKEE
jgi:uncharacterized protein YsxB (DUF464 family)